MTADEPERSKLDASEGMVPEALIPNRGGTAVVSVADAAGNGITLIQSVFLVFGSGVADPETGIVLNNRMIGFTTEPGHPNCVAPEKRPAHTLNPVLAFHDGRLRTCSARRAVRVRR